MEENPEHTLPAD